MAKIEFTGNVGNVEEGTTKSGDRNYIKFTVAERFSFFNDEIKEWVEKGVQWHDCICWVHTESHAKLERLRKFINKGAGLLVTGRTSINPSEESDNNGKPKYLNSYVIVDDVALTLERLQDVTYKPRVQGPENDPQMQQQKNKDNDPFSEGNNF